MEDLKNKPEEYWKKKLSLDEYRVIRQKGTEPAFTGKFVNNKDKGVYTCAACGQKLFSSDTKFDSGTGWPSFTDPMNPVRSLARAKGASPEDLGEATSNGMNRENVELKEDLGNGMSRMEVLCKNCGAHLGHVFDDGPKDKGGKRYCINSCSLGFNKNDK